MKYPYAVFDANEAPDQTRAPQSCHFTLEAAHAERDRLNRADPNAHYYCVEWDAGRWARERPAPQHPKGI